MKTQITGTGPIKNGRFHVDVVETRWGFLTTHRPVVAVLYEAGGVRHAYYADTFESVDRPAMELLSNVYTHLTSA
jgi:hypothetical protein